MIITRGDRQWNRRTHVFDVCANCNTMQGPRKYGYDPLPNWQDADSPICWRYAFCDIECHNQYWTKHNPERLIR